MQRRRVPDTGDVLAVPLATAMGVTCGAALTKPPAGSAVTTAVCCVCAHHIDTPSPYTPSALNSGASRAWERQVRHRVWRRKSQRGPETTPEWSPETLTRRSPEANNFLVIILPTTIIILQ